MRTFAAFAVLAAAVAAECYDNTDDDGNYIGGNQCDGEYVECNSDCWMEWDNELQEDKEVCETWCWENRSPLEEVLDDVGDALENIGEAIMDPQRVVDDIQDGIHDVMEDLECWWAERAPETTCAKYEREEAERECWDRRDGSEWNWDDDYCMNKEEADQWRQERCEGEEAEWAEQDGCTTTWMVDEWDSWCSWQCEDQDWMNLRRDLKLRNNRPLLAFLERSAEGSVQKRSALNRILAANTQVSVDLDLTELARLGEQAQANNNEVIETLNDFDRGFEELMNEWGPKLEEMAQEKQRQDEQLAMELAGLIGESITVDGTPLSVIIEEMMGEGGHEEEWLMARRVSGARDVRSMFALDSVAPQDVGVFQEEEPTNMNVEISLDTDRMNELIQSVMGAAQYAKEDGEDSLNYFFEAVGELGEDLEDEMECIGEDVEEVLNEVGDFVKSTLMDETKTQVDFSLAQKKPKAKKQESTNYAKAAAGATFGVIALFSIVGLVANQKKSVREHEESLL